MKSVSTTSVLSTVSVHEIKYYTERLIYYGNSEGDDRTLTAYSQTGKVFHQRAMHSGEQPQCGLLLPGMELRVACLAQGEDSAKQASREACLFNLATQRFFVYLAQMKGFLPLLTFL